MAAATSRSVRSAKVIGPPLMRLRVVSNQSLDSAWKTTCAVDLPVATCRPAGLKDNRWAFYRAGRVMPLSPFGGQRIEKLIT